jgi:hypothetical protein
MESVPPRLYAGTEQIVPISPKNWFDWVAGGEFKVLVTRLLYVFVGLSPDLPWGAPRGLKKSKNLRLKLSLSPFLQSSIAMQLQVKTSKR